MKYVIPSVRQKVAGAQDHTSVCLVGTSNMTTSVFRIVVTYLGKFCVLNAWFQFLINIFLLFTIKIIRGRRQNMCSVSS